jgi:hypothetical protein
VKRAIPLLAALLLIGGCHRAKSDALPPDAAAEAQARTSAKALADISAAEQAASTPLPQSAQRAVAREDKPARQAATPSAAADENGGPELSLNESAPR